MMNSNAPKNSGNRLLIRLRENLLLGLISISPFALTLWVFLSVVRFLDEKIYFLIPADFPRIPGIGVVAALVLLLGFGGIARTFFGQALNTWTDHLFQRLPIVRSLYSILRQMSNALFSSSGSSSFKRVVLVPFPNADTHSIAFVANTYSETETVVFVPTAPNPTSGYVLIYKNSDLIASDLEVQEALQIVVSCGAVSKGSTQRERKT